ncbi:MAG: hypothetical protein R3A46_18090 [Thermomicrobiales bacterium]
MSTAMSPPVVERRPMAVSLAVVFTVIGALSTIPFFFLPGNEDVPWGAQVFSVAGAVLYLIGAWGLWNLRRWGAILTFVVTLLNTLAALPGLIERPSGWIVAGILMLIPLGIATLVLIALPASRRAYHS